MRSVPNPRGPRLKVLLRNAALACGMLMVPAMASASLLNLVPVDPDITVTDLTVTYSGGFLTVSGTGSSGGSYNPGTKPIQDLAYTLTAAINPSGTLTSGSFSISGGVAALGVGASVLLAGSLTDFDPFFTTGFSTFEFLFDTTSSASLLGFGPTGGIIINSGDLPGSGFSSDFSGSAYAADTYAGGAPEPSVLLLVAMGLLAARRRCAARRV